MKDHARSERLFLAILMSALAPVSGTPQVNNQVRSDQDVSDCQALYDDSFIKFRQKEYKKAIDGFRDYLNHCKDGVFEDNAQFWIAGSFYESGDYVHAEEEFAVLARTYTTSEKLPTTIYKLGRCSEELGYIERARGYFEQVVNAFPGTTEAELASDKMIELSDPLSQISAIFVTVSVSEKLPQFANRLLTDAKLKLRQFEIRICDSMAFYSDPSAAVLRISVSGFETHVGRQPTGYAASVILEVVGRVVKLRDVSSDSNVKPWQVFSAPLYEDLSTIISDRQGFESYARQIASDQVDKLVDLILEKK